MVSFYRFVFVLMIGAIVAMAALGEASRRGPGDFGGSARARARSSDALARSQAASPRGASNVDADRGHSGTSRWTEPDPVKIAQEFLPIDREAFQAADTLMHAAPGSGEYRQAQGRLLREAGETTGRVLRDTAKEAFHTVRSKEFWKGLSGK